jgi:hypothetical protein
MKNKTYHILAAVPYSKVTRLTRRVPLVKQEQLTLPEHMSSSQVLMGLVLFDI